MIRAGINCEASLLYKGDAVCWVPAHEVQSYVHPVDWGTITSLIDRPHRAAQHSHAPIGSQGFISSKNVSLQIFWALGTVFEVLLAILVMPTLGWRWLLGLSTIPLFIFAFFSFVSIQLNMLDLKGFGRGSEAALLVKWLKLISLVDLHRYCVNVLLSDYFISSAERKTRLIDHQRRKKYPTVILEQKDHEKSPSWFEKKRVDAAEREDHWLT